MKCWSVIILSLLHCLRLKTFVSGRELPCDFFDSVDISAGIHHSNKSITFDGIEYLEKNYAEINYILKDENKPIKVKPYPRGCSCSIRPCIRLCCPYGSMLETVTFSNGTQNVECSKNAAAMNLESEVIHENNETTVLKLDQHFAYVDRLCKNHFYAGDFKVTDVNIFVFDFINNIYIKTRFHFIRKATFCLKEMS